MTDFDWTLIKTFLAVAQCGSYSAAARMLSISQPTIGRQVQQLEAQLGAPLFERDPKGQRLTSAGVDLMDEAMAMKAAAARISLRAAGQSQTLSGVVRITASLVVSHHVLPPILAKIRAQEPAIELELHPSDDTENLLYREADIAVRMYRPEQLGMITRKVGEQRLGLFAAKTYVARRGSPVDARDIGDHDLIGFDRSDLIIKGMSAMQINVDRAFFKLRCDNQTVYWELVAAGCGIGVAPLLVGAADARVVRVVPDLEVGTLPIWLTAPEALRTSPRIRRVYDMLAGGMGRSMGIN
jgi:DNA-binding transcriptional LysR family regulator